MGETSHKQRIAKRDIDEKLAASKPSRELLEELALSCAKTPSTKSTFQYAFALSKSTEPSELRYSITLLDGLIIEGYEHQIDCSYGAAIALYLLGDYDESRIRCENILRSHPQQARFVNELHLACLQSIDERNAKHAKQAAVGGLVAAAGIGLAAGVASLLLKR